LENFICLIGGYSIKTSGGVFICVKKIIIGEDCGGTKEKCINANVRYNSQAKSFLLLLETACRIISKARDIEGINKAEI